MFLEKRNLPDFQENSHDLANLTKFYTTCNENNRLKLCVLCTHRADYFCADCFRFTWSGWYFRFGSFRIDCSTVNMSSLPFRLLP